jgi:hypothetical protein
MKSAEEWMRNRDSIGKETILAIQRDAVEDNNAALAAKDAEIKTIRDDYHHEYERVEELAAENTRLILEMGTANREIARLKAEVERLQTLPPCWEGNPQCSWNRADDFDDERNWESQCGKEWMFGDGGPKENQMRYCPFCGGKLVLPPDPKGEPQ